MKTYFPIVIFPKIHLIFDILADADLKPHQMCETPKNPNFQKNGKIVISVKIRSKFFDLG